MSTDVAILSETMDTDALQDEGPYRSDMTSQLEPGGTFEPEYDRAQYDVTRPGKSPHGGITYIDQAVGGDVGIREDAAAGPVRGVFSYRSRTQPFNGDFIGARFIPAGRDQGYVGRQTRNTAMRATSLDRTELPDRGEMVAGFTNPALASMLAKMRKGGE